MIQKLYFRAVTKQTHTVNISFLVVTHTVFFRDTSCSVCCWRQKAVLHLLWALQDPTVFMSTRFDLFIHLKLIQLN